MPLVCGEGTSMSLVCVEREPVCPWCVWGGSHYVPGVCREGTSMSLVCGEGTTMSLVCGEGTSMSLVC